MIITCPSCDSYFPINVEIAQSLSTTHMICPACEKPFDPSGTDDDPLDLRIESIKDELVINKSLQNTTRWFEDC